MYQQWMSRKLLSPCFQHQRTQELDILEDVMLVFGKYWSTFFSIFWHFKDQKTNRFIEKLIYRLTGDYWFSILRTQCTKTVIRMVRTSVLFRSFYSPSCSARGVFFVSLIQPARTERTNCYFASRWAGVILRWFSGWDRDLWYHVRHGGP